MSELTITLESDLMSKLKDLEVEINRNIAPAVKLGKDHPVNIREVATALIELGLCETTTNRVAINAMFALEQMRK